MGLRIHFTAEDLARVRVAPTLGPLAETWFSLSLLRCPRQRPPMLAGWREQARRHSTADVARTAALIPRGSLGIDLATLTGPAGTLDEGLDALLGAPPDAIRAEADALAEHFPVPDGVQALADGGGAAREDLAGALRSSYRTLVEPHWERIGAHLHTERAVRGRLMADGGVDGLLRSLHPRLTWRPPTLEARIPGNLEIHLGGRGLDLIPSLFIGEFIALLHDTRDPLAAPRLILPTARDPLAASRLWTEPGRTGHPEPGTLNALLGRTRARVLQRVADGCSTTELAQYTGISPAAASQHATVLRGAGLIATRRRGGEVLHTLTPLGLQLITGAGA